MCWKSSTWQHKERCVLLSCRGQAITASTLLPTLETYITAALVLVRTTTRTSSKNLLILNNRSLCRFRQVYDGRAGSRSELHCSHSSVPPPPPLPEPVAESAAHDVMAPRSPYITTGEEPVSTIYVGCCACQRFRDHRGIRECRTDQQTRS